MNSNTKTDKLIDFDIRPKAGILGVFSRLSYKHEYAIAEFVDNSTQSFFTNEKTLNNHGVYKVKIQIAYDHENRILIIKDDAFGMEIEDFKRALLMDRLPTELNSRNEFGMGLKTAASWFGTVWSVESTAFGSTNKFFSEVDIKGLRETGENNVKINVSKCNPEEHFTRIVIKDITKRMSYKVIQNVKSLLGSMYRRDINSNKVEIFFNGESLDFQEYEPLFFRNQTWTKDVDFEFDFEEKIYRIKGFVGILKNGSYKKAGFALFRRNRMVIGGENQNYKPQEIFGQPQSQISLKLYGELDLDDFQINQAKDGFIWNEGLQEEFLKNLNMHIKDYIQIAKMSRSDIDAELKGEEIVTDEYSKKIKNKVERSIALLKEDLTIEEKTEIIVHDLKEDVNYNQSDEQTDIVTDYVKGTLKSEVEEHNTTFLNSREYDISIDKYNIQKFKVQWITGNDKFWFDINREDDALIIDLNITHPFYKPFSSNDDFKVIIEKFVIAFVISLENSKIEQNIFDPEIFIKYINKFLLEMSRV